MTNLRKIAVLIPGDEGDSTGRDIVVDVLKIPGSGGDRDVVTVRHDPVRIIPAVTDHDITIFHIVVSVSRRPIIEIIKPEIRISRHSERVSRTGCPGLKVNITEGCDCDFRVIVISGKRPPRGPVVPVGGISSMADLRKALIVFSGEETDIPVGGTGTLACLHGNQTALGTFRITPAMTDHGVVATVAPVAVGSLVSTTGKENIPLGSLHADIPLIPLSTESALVRTTMSNLSVAVELVAGADPDSHFRTGIIRIDVGSIGEDDDISDRRIFAAGSRDIETGRTA